MQVLHGAGRFPEIGAGAGEYAEQYFSHMSRLAAALRDASNAGEAKPAISNGRLCIAVYPSLLLTALSCAGTVDALTEAALHYCREKTAGIPEALKTRSATNVQALTRSGC